MSEKEKESKNEKSEKLKEKEIIERLEKIANAYHINTDGWGEALRCRK